MGWSIGYDDNWKRDIGYGVPATCDHPGCGERINRGLSYVCGGEPYGGDEGCGLYFCAAHLTLAVGTEAITGPQLCERCGEGGEPFLATKDVPEWINHKLTDPSWEKWRKQNPDEVKTLRDVFGTEK